MPEDRTKSELAPEEAERRAKELAHRLLNTPPKPRSTEQSKKKPRSKPESHNTR